MRILLTILFFIPLLADAKLTMNFKYCGKHICIYTVTVTSSPKFVGTTAKFGTGSNVDRSANSDWTTPTAVNANDNTTAGVTGVAGSDYLVASAFTFTEIPINATIIGVTGVIGAAESSTGSETTSMQLQNASATLFGGILQQSVNGTGETVYTYGGAANMWSLNITTLTPTIIRNSNFGVRVWFETAHNMTVDYITVAVEFSCCSLTLSGIG